MQYTAIIKDGGLFIPNVFSDIEDGVPHLVQVEVDIEEVRQQLSPNKELTKASPKRSKKVAQKLTRNMDLENYKTSNTESNSELEGLNDKELSEIFKAYVNEGQISLENL